MQERTEPDERYSTLLQMTVGQEEVEETISRDIHRTFPEHPQFLNEQSQQSLFNLLKAYSLVDIEVCAASCMRPCIVMYEAMK